MGSKPPDSHAVPLCPICHSIRHDNGSGEFWSCDVKMVIIGLLTEYLANGN